MQIKLFDKFLGWQNKKRNNLKQLKDKSNYQIRSASTHSDHTETQAESKYPTQVSNKPDHRNLLVSTYLSDKWTLDVDIDQGQVILAVAVHLLY